MKIKIITALNSDSLEERVNDFITYREEIGHDIITHSILDIKFDNYNGYVAYIQYEDNIRRNLKYGIEEPTTIELEDGDAE